MSEILTQQEKEKILRAYFESLDPPVLKIYTNKPSRKPVVLAQIATLFERERQYTEREVTDALRRVWEDPILLRRDMIDYGVLCRTRDGRSYWRAEEKE